MIEGLGWQLKELRDRINPQLTRTLQHFKDHKAAVAYLQLSDVSLRVSLGEVSLTIRRVDGLCLAQ